MDIGGIFEAPARISFYEGRKVSGRVM